MVPVYFAGAATGTKRFIVLAPGQALGDVLLSKRVLNLLGDEKQADVGQVVNVGLVSRK